MTFEHYGPPPFAHQKQVFENTWDREAYALLWEMRVGKTKPTIDTAVRLFEENRIGGGFVSAPNGVHLNWSRTAIPEHCHPRSRPVTFEWNAGRANTSKYQKEFDAFLAHDGLTWLCMNGESLITENAQQAIKKFSAWRKPLAALDEAHMFKTPRAQRTKTVLKMRPLFPYRRILTGTPATQGPFDLWSQFNFLDPAILGPTFIPFKQRYGIFKRVRYGSGPSFDELVDYRDLDHLYQRIKPHSSRLTQADVYDLPNQIVERRMFELAPHQKSAYNQLREELLLELDTGAVITATMALTMLLRLQQISRGFVGVDSSTIHDLGSPRPSIAALKSILEQLPGKAIIWCRFRQDVEEVMKLSAEMGRNPIRYDGAVPQEDRPAARAKFLGDPSAKDFVGTPQTGGVGVDLSSADTTIFYSHGWDLAQRLQAIARMQGPNQKSKSLLLVDMVAVGTPDIRCLDAHARKEDLAATVTGDKLRAILSEKL